MRDAGCPPPPIRACSLGNVTQSDCTDVLQGSSGRRSSSTNVCGSVIASLESRLR